MPDTHQLKHCSNTKPHLLKHCINPKKHWTHCQTRQTQVNKARNTPVETRHQQKPKKGLRNPEGHKEPRRAHLTSPEAYKYAEKSHFGLGTRKPKGHKAPRRAQGTQKGSHLTSPEACKYAENVTFCILSRSRWGGADSLSCGSHFSGSLSGITP